MTDEQIAQRNRENSTHSTGPRTDTGRQRSSLNAYRNGLNGQIVCSTPEELASFKLFCAEIREELAPVGPTERFLAKSISENMFRLERARSIEGGIWADGYRAHVEEIESGHPEVDTALSASRTFLLLVEHAESKGETYEPGEDFTPAAEHAGFVFVRQESLADLVN